MLKTRTKPSGISWVTTVNFLEEEGSEDCFGRCLWALCYTLGSSVTPQNVKRTIGEMIQRALPHCLKLISPRAKAYIVIGLGCLSDGENTDYISGLTSSLAEQYDLHNDGDWH